MMIRVYVPIVTVVLVVLGSVAPIAAAVAHAAARR